MRMKLYQDRDWLYQKYIVERLTTRKIAVLCRVNHVTILNWLHKFNIPIIEKEEVLEKIRLSRLGKPSWNKGLTKETSEAVFRISKAREGENNPMYGKKPWNKGIKGCHTEESLSHILLFEKGHIPWNKDKKFPQIAGSNNYRWNGGKKAMKERQKKDLKYRLNKRIRNLLICHMKKSQKRGRHWEDLVSYTINQLKKRLKETMPVNYAWRDFLNGELHIDHILPIKLFQFKTPEDEEFRQCWNLYNLRLLPAKENIIKKDKITNPILLYLLFKEEKLLQPALAIYKGNLNGYRKHI